MRTSRAAEIFLAGQKAGERGQERRIPHWLASGDEGPKELWLRGWDTGDRKRAKKSQRKETDR